MDQMASLFSMVYLHNKHMLLWSINITIMVFRSIGLTIQLKSHAIAAERPAWLMLTKKKERLLGSYAFCVAFSDYGLDAVVSHSASQHSTIKNINVLTVMQPLVLESHCDRQILLGFKILLLWKPNISIKMFTYFSKTCF